MTFKLCYINRSIYFSLDEYFEATLPNRTIRYGVSHTLLLIYIYSNFNVFTGYF